MCVNKHAEHTYAAYKTTMLAHAGCKKKWRNRLRGQKRGDAYTVYEKIHTTSMHKIFSLTYEHSGEKEKGCAVCSK